MKKISIVLAGVLVSAFAFASKPGEGSASKFAVVKKEDGSFKLFYQSANTAEVKVTIADSEGKVVFREWIKNPKGFIRPYNLKGLAWGQYTVTVDDGETAQSEAIEHRQPSLNKAANIVQLADNKYMLSVNGQLVSGQIDVKIYDGRTLVYKTQNTVDGDFSRLYRMENISNPITFEVTDSKGKKLN